MSQKISEELISAYLDGELTGEQQEQVEQLLMDSAEHRQMFNDMRALRDKLQALPKYSLGDGFAEEVLRRAASVETSKSESNATGKPETQPTHSTSRGGYRTVIWVAVASAAALLLAVLYVPTWFSTSTPDNTAQRNRADDQDKLAANNSQAELQGDAQGGRSEGGQQQQSVNGPDKLLGRDQQSAGGDASDRAKDSATVEQLQKRLNALEGQAEKRNSGGSAPAGRGGFGGGGGAAKGSVELSSGALKRSGSKKGVPKNLDSSFGGAAASKKFQDQVAEPYLVYVELPHQAAGVVDTALADNGVALVSGPPEAAKLGATPGKSFDSNLRRQSRSVENAMRRATGKPAEHVELLVVNATTEQIAAACAKLKASGIPLSIHQDQPADARQLLLSQPQRVRDEDAESEKMIRGGPAGSGGKPEPSAAPPRPAIAAQPPADKPLPPGPPSARVAVPQRGLKTKDEKADQNDGTVKPRKAETPSRPESDGEGDKKKTGEKAREKPDAATLDAVDPSKPEMEEAATATASSQVVPGSYAYRVRIPAQLPLKVDALNRFQLTAPVPDSSARKSDGGSAEDAGADLADAEPVAPEENKQNKGRDRAKELRLAGSRARQANETGSQRVRAIFVIRRPVALPAADAAVPSSEAPKSKRD